jgi:alkylation response protein AidB-like acyl-CoA dehydrogenase
VAHTLALVGTPEQQATIIPPVLAGEMLICLGYSEPDSGSDVAAAKTRAVRDGDSWVINGQKMFTTLAHESRFVFLLTRTNPDVPKHRGLTMFLVPMDAPGIEVQPIHTLGGERTNITFYTDVRVSDSARVGEVDGGWEVMKVALAFERQPTAHGQAARLLHEVEDWAGRALDVEGYPVLDDLSVRERLARIAVDNAAGEVLRTRMYWEAEQGRLPIVEGSMAKLWASEALQRAASELLDVLGVDAVVSRGEPGAPMDGSVEHTWRHAAVTTIYAGSSEIQRSIIAERGLGLPRARPRAD